MKLISGANRLTSVSSTDLGRGRLIVCNAFPLLSVDYIISGNVHIYSESLIQWNLSIKDKLGPSDLFTVERLSTLQRSLY